MIATNDNAYSGIYDGIHNRLARTRDYSPEEIAAIINSGSLSEQQQLSRNYFNRNGYYKQIIIHYATLLKYVGLLIPNPSYGKNLSNSHIKKRYNDALNYIENMQLPILLTNIAQRALVDGAYYGIVTEVSKDAFQLIDLPVGYACSRFKDIYGNDVVEFDLSYFTNIVDENKREAALEAYPNFIQKAYRALKKGKRKSRWVVIPSDLGVCFPFFDGRPLLLSVIPATIEYDAAVEAELDRDAEEIRKIIIQKIPHLSDGRLLFEPDEAEEMHEGTVGMLKGNKNISVLTSYGDVEVASSTTSDARTDSALTRMEKNIYAQAGVSSEIFAPSGSSSLETSINNDTALMMYLANKFARFITNMINKHCANGNVSFTYQIMPVTYHNTNDFISSSFKLVASGYSALLPALAFGISQRDLINIKDLENDVLKLGERLIPLSNAYTQSSSTQGSSPTAATADSDENGRPALKGTEKSEKTVENEKSLDKTGGS